jgi:hypothetical protein
MNISTLIPLAPAGVEALRNAPMADLLKAPASIEAQELVDELCRVTLASESLLNSRQRARTPEAYRQYRNTVGALVADLLKAQSNTKAEGFCYRSTDKQAFCDTVGSSRAYETIRRHWATLGLLEYRNGFTPTGDFDGSYRLRGWAARLRATPKLLALAATFDVSPSNVAEHFLVDHSASFPIILRKQKTWSHTGQAQRVRIERTAQVLELAAEVREINKTLAKHTYSFGEAPIFRRVFNNADADPLGYRWNQGGRLYAAGASSYQSLTATERLAFRIDGEAVAEIDIKASHLSVFYGLLGVPFDSSSDPYEIPGMPRDIVKAFITAAFGKGELPSGWPKALVKAYEDKGIDLRKGYPIKQQRERILERHPILSQLREKNIDWATLQFWESLGVIQTLRELMQDHGIPALPVHDSIIVKRSDVEFAVECLTEMFEQILCVKPALAVKTL